MYPRRISFRFASRSRMRRSPEEADELGALALQLRGKLIAYSRRHIWTKDSADENNGHMVPPDVIRLTHRHGARSVPGRHRKTVSRHVAAGIQPDPPRRRNNAALGYDFFDSNGDHMCFLSMNPDRPKWKSERPTAEEGLSAMQNCGHYIKDLEERRTLRSGETETTS